MYSFSVNIFPTSTVCSWLEVTIYLAKYRTDSNSFDEIPIIKDILFGLPFEYQIWETGDAKVICPILSLLTLALVTSTPHFSQTKPLYLILLYFPQEHSQSFVGPNITSQNNPSLSGLSVL